MYVDGVGGGGPSCGEEAFSGGKEAPEETGYGALTNESHRDLLLAMTPGRMFRTGASENACIFTQQGRKGCNQDAMLVWEVSKQASKQTLRIRVTQKHTNPCF